MQNAWCHIEGEAPIEFMFMNRGISRDVNDTDDRSFAQLQIEVYSIDPQ